MSEEEQYRELVKLTKDRSRWEESVPYVSSLLDDESVKIRAKALWLLGEIGLVYPLSVQNEIPWIASFFESPLPLLRERAVNAVGRIGRGSYDVIGPYWEKMFRLACDEEAKVRMSFIWASENIATNTPGIYGGRMEVFAKLLHDADDRVRTEAPEVFRVLGKRKPRFVQPYLGQLKKISQNDPNRVVRLHCLGAIRAAGQEDGVMMTDLKLHTPGPEDGWFYVKMLSDPATMAYNAPWFPPNGCIPDPETEWEDIQENWIGQEPVRFYAFLQRISDGAFVGDVNYHYSPECDRYDMGIVIYASERGKGYGRQGLRLLLDRAFRIDGVPGLHNDFETARGAAWRIHREVGFREAGEENGIVHLELTREEYLLTTADSTMRR